MSATSERETWATTSSPRTPSPPAPPRPAQLLPLDRRDETGTGGLERRNQAEEERRQHRETEGEEQDPGIQAEVEPRGQVGGLQAGEQRAGPGGQQQPDPRRDQGQHQALHEELADELPPPGPQRQAHGGLAPPAVGARQQHVSQVGAGDQQDHGDHGRQQDARLDVASPLVGIDLGAEQRQQDEPLALVLLRVIAGEDLGQEADLGLALLHRHPILEAPDDAEDGRPALVEEGGHAPSQGELVHHAGHPEVAGIDPARAGEAAGSHADHHELPAVELDRTAEDPPVAPEPPLPEVVAQHDHGVAVGGEVLLGQEGAAELRPDPEQIEIVAGDHLAVDQLGVAPHGEAEDGRGVDGEAGKAPGLPGQVGEVRMGDVLQVGAPLRRAEDPDQALRLAHRERLQEDRLHHREDRRVGADGERQREHRAQGEAGPQSQAAEAVPKIPEQRFHAVASSPVNPGASCQEKGGTGFRRPACASGSG